MISRRLIRIKVLQMAYSHVRTEDKDLAITEKELIEKSIKSSTDLYYLTISLLSDLKYMAAKRIDAARNKYIPTESDLNPNMRFVENPVILKIEQSSEYKRYISNNVISWDNDETLSYFYNKLTNSNFYAKYMNLESPTFKDHIDFTVRIMSDVIMNDEIFYQCTEEKNIYWNDDYSVVMPAVLRTLKRITEEDDIIFDNTPLARELYRDNADDLAESIEFAKVLLRRTVLDRKNYTELIAPHAVNWKIERMSEMDRLIMDMAITEWLNFEEIPIKVTINEYLDIAKAYSSEKSNAFINGVLDKILSDLKESGKIHKSGRGLIG